MATEQLRHAADLRDAEPGPCWTDHCRGTVMWAPKGTPGRFLVECDDTIRGPHRATAYLHQPAPPEATP